MLIFGDFPNALTWVGIVIIVGSGLYIIHRERLSRQPSPRNAAGRHLTGRITSILRAENRSRTGPADLVRGADHAVGRKAQPLQWPAQPLALPRHRPHRKQRQPRAHRQVQHHLQRRQKRHILRRQDQRALPGCAHQRVQNRQPMIQPRARESQPQHEGRRNRPQRLVKIGRLLFRNRKQPPRQPRLRRRTRSNRSRRSPPRAPPPAATAGPHHHPPQQSLGQTARARASAALPKGPPPASVTPCKDSTITRFIPILFSQLRQMAQGANTINPSNYPVLSMDSNKVRRMLGKRNSKEASIR